MTTYQRATAALNRLVFPLLRVPVLNRVLGRSTLVLAYVGRRSGKAVRLPVWYSRVSDSQLVVRVALPDQKTWWRNFDGDGGPVTVVTTGGERGGHATSRRDESGAVRVAIALDPVG